MVGTGTKGEGGIRRLGSGAASASVGAADTMAWCPVAGCARLALRDDRDIEANLSPLLPL